MDLEALRDASEVVVEFDGTYDLLDHPTRFTIRRHPSESTWLVELGRYALGAAEPDDLRRFAEGIFEAIAGGSGEPDFLLMDDGYAQVRMTVGWDDGLYAAAEVSFDMTQDLMGHSATGEPLYSNPFGSALIEMKALELEDPAYLTTRAQTLLAALNTAECG